MTKACGVRSRWAHRAEGAGLGSGSGSCQGPGGMGRARGVDRSLQLQGRGWGSTWPGNRDGGAGLHGDRHPGDSRSRGCWDPDSTGQAWQAPKYQAHGQRVPGLGLHPVALLPNPTLHPKHLCSEQCPFRAFLTLTWVPPAKSCPRPGQARPRPRAGARGRFLGREVEGPEGGVWPLEAAAQTRETLGFPQHGCF